jgi:hypothetical protein
VEQNANDQMDIFDLETSDVNNGNNNQSTTLNQSANQPVPLLLDLPEWNSADMINFIDNASFASNDSGLTDGSLNYFSSM